MTALASAHALDRYMPASLRGWLEERYYARVGEQSRLERLIGDDDFWRAPERHVALFADHGVVHVRDIAARVLQVLEQIDGVLIPAREPQRIDGFMRGYGVILAYLHDIGMVDLSAFGRRMHPEFAAQAVFTPELDWLVATIWAENVGDLASRLLQLERCGALEQPPEQVLRELLALSLAHSKSKVPTATLNDPDALRRLMQTSLSSELHELHRRQTPANGGADAMQPAPQATAAANLGRLYADFANESYRWLVGSHPALEELREDVVDTLRALRCADALRQRGTVIKSSAGYEIYINQRSGYAECAMRLDDDRLYMLELPDLLATGEANLASAELDRAGDLRVAFHRGHFAGAAALAWAVEASARVLGDIQADVIGSFERGPRARPAPKAAGSIQILLERVADNPAYAELVRERLATQLPDLAVRIELTVSLGESSERERARYLAAGELDWGPEQRQDLLRRIARSGLNVATIDQATAFRQVRLTTARAGEVLIEAGAPSAFVYVPLGDGMLIVPLGGYPPFSVRAWMPIGSTGVVRGAMRNATVVAEGELPLLIIPREVYLERWHRPYTAAELRRLLAPQA